MQPEQWEVLNRQPLYLDQTGTLLQIDRDEVERYYEPLARVILHGSAAAERRVVVVAGSPGSGKSAFAAVLAAVVNALAGAELAICVGQDGWHLSNRELDSRWIEWDGERVKLRAIKGAPETYDHAAVSHFVSKLKSQPRLPFPVYSRAMHDPIPAGGTVEERHRIVILEGTYWLLDEPPWNGLQRLYDLRILLDAEISQLWDGLMARHLRGGRTAEAAAEHIRRVDFANVERVRRRLLPADVVVTKADSRTIDRVEFPPQE